jgi:uncharacterized protein
MLSATAPHPLFTRWSHGGPRRVLAIDGGGVRGIVALAFLARIESAVQKRWGVRCLAEHFDLIAGTSTGAIIATMLALGRSVEEIRAMYMQFCREAFTPNPLGTLSFGLLASRFRLLPIQQLAQQLFGDICLGDPSIRTGLLVMLHRADSNSPWPVHNHPHGKFYANADGADNLANKDLLLANLVLGSCAAPGFFHPRRMEIGRRPDGQIVEGLFVDGSVSPHKNPAMQALRVATIPDYGFGWPLGENRLEIVSVGTGFRTRRLSYKRMRPSGLLAAETLLALLDSCNDEVELMLQWMSNSPVARSIDSEVNNLAGVCLTGQPAFKYWRWNLILEQRWLETNLGCQLDDRSLNRLYRMDGVNNIAELESLAKKCANLLIPDSFE